MPLRNKVTMPRVSVVIPTFNRLDLVRRALESVYAQTYPDYEILLVDDGSDEPVGELAGAYPQIRLLRHEHNRGAAAARNTGIQASDAEFIAFLDSDDCWLPQKLQVQVELLDADPGLGGCITGYTNHTTEGSWTYRPQKPGSWLRQLSMGSQLGPGTTLMVRRACYAVVGYLDEQMPRLEDLDWLLRFVQHYDLGVIAQPLATVYRSGFSSAARIEQANILLVQKNMPAFHSLGRFHASRAIAKRWLETAVHHYREGNRRQGSAYLFKAIRTNPLQRPGMYLRILESLTGPGLIDKVRKSLRSR
jgi:glycosyltransferase involved in cell wall biosynthesis